MGPPLVHQKKIVSLIERRMAALGMSQVRLAANSGVCRSHLIAFLKGRKQIGSDKLAMIMKVLRLTLKVESGRRKAATPAE